MAMGDHPILEINLDGHEVVARASGEKPSSIRWTVLSIYAVKGRPIQGITDPFVTEIIGETTVTGEARRVRRAAFATLSAALQWRAFNQTSFIYTELLSEARTWAERKGEQLESPFTGDTFREALTWLYGDEIDVAVTRFVADWGTEIDGKADVFEVIDREDDDGMPGWAETFVRAMRHFNRESFHAARAR